MTGIVHTTRTERRQKPTARVMLSGSKEESPPALGAGGEFRIIQVRWKASDRAARPDGRRTRPPQPTLVSWGPQRPRQPAWQRWFARLKEVARLPANWDSYGAPAPAPVAVVAAGKYLALLEVLAWEPSRVEASAMGGVGVTHRVGRRKVYVEFYNDGRIHALFSDGDPARLQTAPLVPGLEACYRFVKKAREYLFNG